MPKSIPRVIEMREEERAYVKASYPNEGCWMLLDNSSFIPLENLSSSPLTEFKIDTKELLKYKGRIKVICHSHPNTYPVPSKRDMESQIAANIPFGIASVYPYDQSDAAELLVSPLITFSHKQNDIIRPKISMDTLNDRDPKKSSLSYRFFMHGINDCYSLVRDFYFDEFNIDLPECPRSWEWWEAASYTRQSMYLKNMKKCKFRILDEKEPKQLGDLVLMCIRSSRGPNHAAIYLGDGYILHHLASANSLDRTKIPHRDLVGTWSNFITHWGRRLDK